MIHANYCRQFLSDNGVLLDVGSGKGKFLCRMAGFGFKTIGIEVNQEYIDETLERAAKENIEVRVEKGEAELLPFSDNYFDFVNCAEVIEHVEEPQQVCKEIYRVLKPGHKCYISFHNRFGFYDYHYRLYFINWLPRKWTEPVLKFLKKQKADGIAGRQKLTTMHYFTNGKVKKFLEDIGFSVKDIRVEKIRKEFGILSPFFLFSYKILLRPFYFNTFHLLLKKKIVKISILPNLLTVIK